MAPRSGDTQLSAHDVTAYEVRCHHCKVSFPPGTRRCLHCGGPTGAPPIVSATPSGIARMRARQATYGAVDDDDELEPRRGPVRIAMGMVWLLLAVGLSFYRMCSG